MAKRITVTPTPDLNKKLNAELLGQAIKARRTQSQLRLEDCAALCGVAKQTLMNLEHGQGNTQLATVLQICASLGIRLFIEPWQEDEANDGWF